ncbi:MAG: serine/threonine-protein phosphatase [Eubacterium sp.]|nr:serine/threonine-protein phosphatase [Eubacterium sp.]
MEFEATYNTDIGIRKSTNQDSLALRIIDTPDGQVAFAIVCDGMGGLAKGELASKEVISAFCRWFDEEFVCQVVEGSFSATRLRDDWNSIIQTENRLLGIYGSDNNIMLGTTVSAILMYKGEFYIVHVGDSRVYELTDTARILTKDQTFVAREVAAGRMTPEEAKLDPRRSVLLQCVGASATVTPDFLKGKVLENCVYLICSDGFRHQISEEEIMEKLSPTVGRTLDELKYGCVYLTELDKNRKETDNITIAVISVK